MGLIIPSVPYKSQYDADADEFRNDCGPASLAMILQSYGVHVSTDAVYRKTGATANRYVSIGQLMRAALGYGVPFEYFYDWSLEQLMDTLSQGRPLITLIHYGAWSQLDPGVSTQNSFEGPHFVVVLGYDDQHIYVNDPLWKLDRRNEGYRRAWPHEQFMAAWNSNHLDGNRDRSGIFSQRVLPTRAYSSANPSATPLVDFTHVESQRMQAWIKYFALPEPDSSNPASLNAYQSAMSKWGQQYVEHEVTAEEDLTLIAEKYYGDPAKWQVILAYNALTEVDTIHDGQQLKIPEPQRTASRENLIETRRGGTFNHSNLGKEQAPTDLSKNVIRPVMYAGTNLSDNASR